MKWKEYLIKRREEQAKTRDQAKDRVKISALLL